MLDLCFESFIVCSGEEVGPLLMELPLVNMSVSAKNRKVLTDKSNTCEVFQTQSIDLACGDSGLAAFSESCLLNKVIVGILSLSLCVCVCVCVVCVMLNFAKLQ